MRSALSTTLSARSRKCAIYRNGQRTSPLAVIKSAFLSPQMFALSLPPRMRKGTLFLRTPGWALKWDRSGQGFGSHWRGLGGSPRLLLVVQLRLSFLTPCPLFLSSSFLPPFSPCTACLLKVPEASLRPTWFPGCSSRPASCAVCLPSHPCPPAWGKEQGLSGLQQYL